MLVPSELLETRTGRKIIVCIKHFYFICLQVCYPIFFKTKINTRKFHQFKKTTWSTRPNRTYTDKDLLNYYLYANVCSKINISVSVYFFISGQIYEFEKKKSLNCYIKFKCLCSSTFNQKEY